MTTQPSSPAEPERVRIIVGNPEFADGNMLPVTIHDMRDRRLKFQRVSRDQLAVMNGDTMGEWTAYWSQSREQWTLAEYLGDMNRKAVA